MTERYLLKSGADDWREVTREDWIRAERMAGFRPKCASNDPKYWTTLATGGFTAGQIAGRIEYVC